jgi:hypothetical protein
MRIIINTENIVTAAAALEAAGCEVFLNKNWYDLSMKQLTAPGKQHHLRGGCSTWEWPTAVAGDIVTDGDGRWLVVANYATQNPQTGVYTSRWSVFARIRI